MIEIARIERALRRRPRLGERLFTERERALADGRARPARHLAARFAAKEAAVKALGLDWTRLGEVEVVATETGAPELDLRGLAAEVARTHGLRPRVSLTHDRSTAAAVVVCERFAG